MANNPNLTHLKFKEKEIILVGTGDTLRFPPAAWTAGYLACGIGVEIMDTAAACRTYNVLMAEGRRVAAGLLPLESGAPST